MLADKHQPTSLTFLSSGMGKNTIAKFDKLSHIPSLIIAAVGDEFTYKSSNQIFLNASNDTTRLLAYKGADFLTHFKAINIRQSDI